MSAAERVIERLRAALEEQTSRANHHEERATEFAAEVERLTRERDSQRKRADHWAADCEKVRDERDALVMIGRSLDNTILSHMERGQIVLDYGNLGLDVFDRFRAALGEVQP